MTTTLSQQMNDNTHAMVVTEQMITEACRVSDPGQLREWARLGVRVTTGLRCVGLLKVVS
jgi:hypothetical protein